MAGELNRVGGAPARMLQLLDALLAFPEMPARPRRTGPESLNSYRILPAVNGMCSRRGGLVEVAVVIGSEVGQAGAEPPERVQRATLERFAVDAPLVLQERPHRIANDVGH